MKTYKKTIVEEKPRLEIGFDQFADNPRNWDNIGYFITCDSRYNSPDDNEELKSLIQNTGDESNSLEEHINKIKTEMTSNGYGKVVYITPVYKYEHGNIVYRRGRANCFDISNNGFYIITDKTLKEYTADQKQSISCLEEVIDNELKIYTQWANGEVYYFTLYDENGERRDGYGDIYDLQDIKDGLPADWKDEKLDDYMIN